MENKGTFIKNQAIPTSYSDLGHKCMVLKEQFAVLMQMDTDKDF